MWCCLSTKYFTLQDKSLDSFPVLKMDFPGSERLPCQLVTTKLHIVAKQRNGYNSLHNFYCFVIYTAHITQMKCKTLYYVLVQIY